MTRRIIQLVALAAMLLAPAPAATWIAPPIAFSNAFGSSGPDGIPGTADDATLLPGEVFIQGIQSGYSAGSYDRDPNRYPGEPGGGPLSAFAVLTTYVSQNALGLYRYVWQLENRGTGDLIAYFDTNGGALPNFITVTNNFGDPELDGSAVAPMDQSVAASIEIQTVTGGPPVPLQWGGGWNPETDTDADSVFPSPEPASAMMLVISALAFLATLYLPFFRVRSHGGELSRRL